MYIIIRWLCCIIVKSFFKTVHVINEERIPLYGPVIFVGNHNNQFMDATMLVATIPRKVRFLIAEKSLKRKVIGDLARAAGAIGVKRAGDIAYIAIGKAVWEENSYKLKGISTRFKIDMKQYDRLEFAARMFTIDEIISDEEIRLQQKISAPCPNPTAGVKLTVIPKVDQSLAYDAVSDSLKTGDTVGMFPEGSSHDRPTLLPLKPGVAIMALCSILEGAEDVMIVPVGLLYHEPHKLQSTASVYFGLPIPVSEEVASEYQVDRVAAVSKVLRAVEEGMKSCMVTAPDPESMSHFRLCCSLYPPERLNLSNAKMYALQQLISKLLWHYANDKELIELKKALTEYEKKLKAYNILDEDVWMLKHSAAGAMLSLVEKVCLLVVCGILGFPISIFWAPLGIIASYYAENHREQALLGSKVKLKGTDVVASYKVLVLLVLVPTVNIIYGIIFGMRVYGDNWRGLLLSVLLALCVLPLLYYVSIKNVGRCLVIYRHLKILCYVFIAKINIWRDTERELVTSRMHMQLKVRSTVHTLGASFSATFLHELYQTVPKVVLLSDTKRLIFKKDEWAPIHARNYMENREEIL